MFLRFGIHQQLRCSSHLGMHPNKPTVATLCKPGFNLPCPALPCLPCLRCQVVEDIKKRPYDLLDYGRTQFDRDLLEFNVQINDLEAALQVGSRQPWCFGTLPARLLLQPEGL